MEYKDFLQGKRISMECHGFDITDVSDQLFDFQKDIVRWAVKKGKSAAEPDALCKQYRVSHRRDQRTRERREGLDGSDRREAVGMEYKDFLQGKRISMECHGFDMFADTGLGKTIMQLGQAQTIAEALKEELNPFCDRIEIGGSIRRKKPEVGDIELVCIPKFAEVGTGQTTLSGGETTATENMLFGYLHRHFCIPKMGNKQCKIDLNEEEATDVAGSEAEAITVDVFTATESTWGYILLLRTGPWDFSKWVVTELKRKGYVPKDGEVRNLRGTFIPTSTEGGVFNLLGIDYIAPEDRKAR